MGEIDWKDEVEKQDLSYKGNAKGLLNTAQRLLTIDHKILEKFMALFHCPPLSLPIIPLLENQKMKTEEEMRHQLKKKENNNNNKGMADHAASFFPLSFLPAKR